VKIGTTGTDLIKSFEQCRLTAYKPTPNDVWTIGWGHTRGVQEGDTCSQAQADAWLAMDLAEHEDNISKLVTVPLSQNQFDALVSFDYNCGDGNFRSSTLLKCLNARKYALCASEIMKWNKQGGVILGGLVRRRRAEAQLFDTP
jgi:lysozyme